MVPLLSGAGILVGRCVESDRGTRTIRNQSNSMGVVLASCSQFQGNLKPTASMIETTACFLATPMESADDKEMPARAPTAQPPVARTKPTPLLGTECRLKSWNFSVNFHVSRDVERVEAVTQILGTHVVIVSTD